MEAKDELNFISAIYFRNAIEITVCQQLSGGKNGDIKPIQEPLLSTMVKTDEEREQEELNEMIKNELLWIQHDKLKGLPTSNE